MDEILWERGERKSLVAWRDAILSGDLISKKYKRI